MKTYQRLLFEAASHELEARAKTARANAAIQSAKHGETSVESQRYAFEACAYESAVRHIEQTLKTIADIERP